VLQSLKQVRAQTASPVADVGLCGAQNQNCVLGGLVTMHPCAVLDLRAGGSTRSITGVVL
jgi:hypothetical protein